MASDELSSAMVCAVISRVDVIVDAQRPLTFKKTLAAGRPAVESDHLGLGVAAQTEPRTELVLVSLHFTPGF